MFGNIQILSASFLQRPAILESLLFSFFLVAHATLWA